MMVVSEKNFKKPELVFEYNSCPMMLQIIIDDFFEISHILGVKAVCVRIYGKHPGDSGVHKDERASDFRDEYIGSHLYSQEQVDFILKYINSKYKRTDGYKVLIHHKFKNKDGSFGPAHFHMQIPRDIKNLRRL
ncbi:MAG: hypothetical protein GY699_09560 [Desulfobacteraceae bacterium]|nr:hypothetical protein [Desulfobacteraceae bacterium]